MCGVTEVDIKWINQGKKIEQSPLKVDHILPSSLSNMTFCPINVNLLVLRGCIQTGCHTGYYDRHYFSLKIRSLKAVAGKRPCSRGWAPISKWLRKPCAICLRYQSLPALEADWLQAIIQHSGMYFLDTDL